MSESHARLRDRIGHHWQVRVCLLSLIKGVTLVGVGAGPVPLSPPSIEPKAAAQIGRTQVLEAGNRSRARRGKL